MPPVVAAAAVTSAGALGGAALQSRAAGRAARGQQKSTAGAMRMERDREVAAGRRYDTQMAAWQQAFDQREAVRREMLRRAGYDVPEPAAKPPMGSSTRMDGAGAMAPPPGPGAGTLGALSGFSGDGLMDSQAGGPSPAQNMTAPPAAAPGPEAALVPQGGTLGDLAGWSNQGWRRANA
jgi:hypothetical protein